MLLVEQLEFNSIVRSVLFIILLMKLSRYESRSKSDAYDEKSKLVDLYL